jgi:hypothetical protein
MPAFLEPVRDGVFVLRAGPRAVAYSDPYTASGTVVAIGPDACEIRGFTRRQDDSGLALFRDIERALRRAGFSKIMWDRQRPTGVRQTRIDNGLL